MGFSIALLNLLEVTVQSLKAANLAFVSVIVLLVFYIFTAHFLKMVACANVMI